MWQRLWTRKDWCMLICCDFFPQWWCALNDDNDKKRKRCEVQGLCGSVFLFVYLFVLMVLWCGAVWKCVTIIIVVKVEYSVCRNYNWLIYHACKIICILICESFCQILKIMILYSTDNNNGLHYHNI